MTSEVMTLAPAPHNGNVNKHVQSAKKPPPAASNNNNNNQSNNIKQNQDKLIESVYRISSEIIHHKWLHKQK